MESFEKMAWFTSWDAHPSSWVSIEKLMIKK
jgi:hypothetical protein